MRGPTTLLYSTLLISHTEPIQPNVQYTIQCNAMQPKQPDAPADRVNLLECSHVLCRRRTNSMRLDLSRRGEQGRVLSVNPLALERKGM
jgi:hypothetical protein